MSGSIIGKNFQVATWGESHGKALGVVVDGCPAGIPLSREDIQRDLDRRRPGTSPFSTPRSEPDRVEILSGVFEGLTTGTPISLIIQNADHRSSDYDELASLYRPGHADYTYDQKYGIRDHRGGGRSSGRETAARVAAGAIAKKILGELNINVTAYTLSIGDISVDRSRLDISEARRNPLGMPDAEAAEKAARLLTRLKEEKNSIGGVVECVVTGLPAGVGEPVFEKLDGMLGRAVLSIGAVKGVEFGAGFAAARMTGLESNGSYRIDESGNLCQLGGSSGGILGGISDGFPIVLRAAFKPTPSIGIPQDTVTRDGKNASICIKGRHDPIIVPRAVVVVEAMVALTLVDYLFQRILSRMDLIKKALL